MLFFFFFCRNDFGQLMFIDLRSSLQADSNKTLIWKKNVALEGIFLKPEIASWGKGESAGLGSCVRLTRSHPFYFMSFQALQCFCSIAETRCCRGSVPVWVFLALSASVHVNDSHSTKEWMRGFPVDPRSLSCSCSNYKCSVSIFCKRTIHFNLD